MAVKIIRQSNKKINYLMIDFYHLIILALFTLLYIVGVLINVSDLDITAIISRYIIIVFLYYVVFAKFDGENNIFSSIIRKIKYITKKKYILHEKGEYDLWE